MMKSPIVAALVALVASSSIASADMVKPEVKKPLITSTQSLPDFGSLTAAQVAALAAAGLFVGFALSGNNSGSHGG
jgi:hypothetical protein